MKQLLFFAFAFQISVGFTQNQFGIKSNVGDSLPIQVNGIMYYLDSTHTSIRTNFPAFDSLVFPTQGGAKYPIICNFKPDSNYSVTPACCATLDVIPSYKIDNDSLKFWITEETNWGKSYLMDLPRISFRITPPTSDTIYGWYEDHACFPEFKMLSEQKWEYGVPSKCFYWTNISPLQFFKESTDFSEFTEEDGVVYDVFPDFDKAEFLGTIRVRLFDDQDFLVTYNSITKKIVLEYDE